MAKKEANHLYVVIVAVVAVVAVVALVLNSGSLSGAPVYVPSEDRVGTCTDTDEANDPYVPGYSQVGVAKHEDYCLGGRVHQFKCKSSADVGPTPGSIYCPNGCSKGACLLPR